MPSLDLDPDAHDPSIGFPFNGTMVLVKLSNVDELIKEIMDCKEKLQMMQCRQGYFVEPEQLFILPVKVKCIVPSRGPHYYEALEHAQWNNHDEVENEDYRYDYNLWVGSKIWPDDIFFTLQDAQHAVMDAVACKVSNHEYHAKNARAELASLEEKFGFKYVPKPDEEDEEGFDPEAYGD